MKKMVLMLAVIMILLSTVIFISGSRLVAAATTIPDTASQAISIGILNQDPDPAVAGNTVDIRLTVENSGSSSADNLIFQVVPSYPFEEVSGEQYVQSVGAINAYQSGSNAQILKYRLKVNKDATAGTYYLKIKYYVDGYENTSSVTKTVAVNVRNSDSVEIVHIDKTILIPGKQTSLKFVINNVGGAPLRDLTFSWSNSANAVLPVGSDNTKYISYLDVGGSAEVEYQVVADTNVDAGLYTLNLVLKYESSANNKTTINTIAGIYVGGGTDFDVAFSDSASGATSFTVANIGSNPATSVSVIIPEQRGWKVTGSNSVIIGNLNKGDYTVTSFKLQSQADGSGLSNRSGNGRNMNYSNSLNQDTPVSNFADGSGSAVGADSILMQIAYTDTMGERTIINKTIKIGMQNVLSSNNQTGFGNRGQASQPKGISSYIWYIAGAIVLIAGFFVYRRYKKQKLLSPDVGIKDAFKAKKR